MRKRFLEEQGGFTLPEMMVTMMIMIIVLFALYNIFDMSMRVFKFGNDKVEAVENARLGLEKMEREIRAAYPVKGASSTGSNRYRFFNANGNTNTDVSPAPPAQMPSSTQITFGNELGTGDDAIRCGSPCEYITYKLTRTASPSTICTAAVTGPCTLRRVNTANSADTGEPVVEFVKPNGLQFSYFTTTGAVATDQKNISRVEITLQIIKDEGTQTLTTEVSLRNPGIIQ